VVPPFAIVDSLIVSVAVHLIIAIQIEFHSWVIAAVTVANLLGGAVGVLVTMLSLNIPTVGTFMCLALVYILALVLESDRL
jgi:hypothetical protein